MRKATQEEVSAFIDKSFFNENIYPYLSMSKYTPERTVSSNDWEKLTLINNDVTTLLEISFNRSVDLDMSICLYSLDVKGTVSALLCLRSLVKRYGAKSISAVVHQSNERSLKLNKKLLGEPWGCEPNGAWNSKLGRYEDVYYFKKIIA